MARESSPHLGFFPFRFWALLSGCCQILAGHNTDFRHKTFLKQLPASKENLPCTRLTNLFHFTSQRVAHRSLWPTATCGLKQLWKMSKSSWLCYKTHLEGDTAVVFGSLHEDPAVVLLSPVVLKKKKPNPTSNKALKDRRFFRCLLLAGAHPAFWPTALTSASWAARLNPAVRGLTHSCPCALLHRCDTVCLSAETLHL